MEERRIFAEIRVDEDMAIRYAEVNGLSSEGTLDYLEKEFGWLEASGIRLDKAFIADVDDIKDWGRYISYVVSWAFAHSWEDNDYAQIMTYREWRVENGLPEYPPRYRKKHPLICPDSGAAVLIKMIGEGEPTINGDRTSGYVNIATVYGTNKFVRASLIEEAKDLHPEDCGYALHILNEIDETDGAFVRTSKLDEKELVELLKEVLKALQEGRM